MARKGNKTGEWARRHLNDPWVKKAVSQGYRSRAVYKFQEIDEQDKLVKPGMVVVDLGSAPGGWSQWLSQKMQHHAKIVATDILPMDALPDVTFVQGDFTEQAVFDELLAVMDGERADLVISDMAPNMSGMDAIDQPKAMYLVELALDLAINVLRKNGSFVCKAFQGAGFQEWHETIRQNFSVVKSRKPKASRARSREVYIVAKGFLGSDR